MGAAAESIPVAVVGASGYSGAEAIAIILAHPAFVLSGVFGSNRRAGEPLDELHPRFRGQRELRVHATDVESVVASGARAVVLATPHEASNELAGPLLDRDLVVLDISAAFRLASDRAHAAAYGFDRVPSVVERAVYGSPELHRAALEAADLVACPGCYPTSVLVPTRPLVEAGLLDDSHPIIADCISGTSGAGRAASVTTLVSEVSVQAYKVGAHRHEPEMIEHIGHDVMFTPHLGCFDRGICSTLHAALAPGADSASVRRALEERYASEPFVRVVPEGATPAIRDVVRTNFCDIGVHVDERRHRVILTSCLDNLVKGASGQAVQCMNIRFGLEETAGLGPHARGQAVRV
ncbi:MAG: N-acetyl-gamma-glutamyl-phosphate reductase [Planctomycetota bacterium]